MVTGSESVRPTAIPSSVMAAPVTLARTDTAPVVSRPVSLAIQRGVRAANAVGSARLTGTVSEVAPSMTVRATSRLLSVIM